MIDSNVSHNEFISLNNVKKKCNMKEAIKIPDNINHVIHKHDLYKKRSMSEVHFHKCIIFNENEIQFIIMINH